MKLPGQLGEGDRNIPLAETSRRKMGSTLFQHLARIRKDEGVDPDRYPPVKFDIEYDTRRTMVGAEITARETAVLILPAIRSAESLGTSNGGRVTRILLILITLLAIATTTLAWLAYQEQVRTAKSPERNNGCDQLIAQNDQLMDLVRETSETARQSSETAQETSDTVTKTHVTTAAETLIGKGIYQYVSRIDDTHITVASNGRSLVLPHSLTPDEIQQLRTAFGIANRIKLR